VQEDVDMLTPLDYIFHRANFPTMSGTYQTYQDISCHIHHIHGASESVGMLGRGCPQEEQQEAWHIRAVDLDVGRPVHYMMLKYIEMGWWIGTFFIPYIGNNHPN
jgi:hypothetical protein